MRKWTKETAERAIKNCEGLTRCSAEDYYKKEFGAEALAKLISGPSKKSVKTPKVDANKDSEPTEELKAPNSEEKNEKVNNKVEKAYKKNNQNQKKQNGFTRTIGDEWKDILVGSTKRKK